MSSQWPSLSAKLADLEALTGIMGVLQWDQQTYMPRGGNGHRGGQLALVTGLSHERLVEPALGEAIEAVQAELVEEPDPIKSAALRELSRKRTRALRVPLALVRAQSEASTEGFVRWMEAREAGSFAPFAPILGELIRIDREIAACHAPEGHLYDAMLEEYDPGQTTMILDPLFARLQAELSPFAAELAARPGPAALDQEFDAAGIDALNRRVLTAMGFRWADGRLDPAQHPFSVGMGPHDVRLTTHAYATDLLATLGGTIHEGGHGLYEQGLPEHLLGTGLCVAAGVGLHESQSRFWENAIGRSRPFCAWLLGQMGEIWPALDLNLESLYGAANRVRPSLIRIKADEVTYNLHILVRYRLEKAMLAGDLQVAELPGAWDDLYQEVVGVRAANLLDGVLQDVHWSSGLLGYFPTYTVGNLYAASFKAQMEAELPSMWEEVGRGELGGVLGWLRQKVHEKGAMESPEEIFRAAVGDRDPVADLMAQLRGRQGELYGVS